MTKAEQIAWRQQGFCFGRYRRGLTLEQVRKQAPEAVHWYLDGKRAGERERGLAV